MPNNLIVHGKPVNQSDGLVMAVPSRLLFTTDCYIQNSLIFSNKDVLNCFNYMVKEPEIKKSKPNLFFH